MQYSEIIREIGRGREGAADLDEETACTLYGAMLDGRVAELELGALLIALRIKGESLAELAGFYRAMQQRLLRLDPPAGRPLPVVLPSYNGARRQANLTPLLALLLAREGVPVLVHGVTADPRRVTSAEVFAALGRAPCRDAVAIGQALWQAGPAFVPVQALSAGMDMLLQLRGRLGLRNSTHTLAKLADPFHGHSLRVASVTHPEYLVRTGEFFRATGARALLLRGCEGEAYANPRRRPRMIYFHDGVEEVLVEAEEGVVAELPALAAAMDAGTTARWTREVLDGCIAVPPPLKAQVSAILRICRG